MTSDSTSTSKSSRDVRVRLVVAPIVLAVVLGTIWLAEHFESRLPLHLLIMFFAIGSGIEFVRMLAPSGTSERLKGGALAWITCGLLAGVGLIELLRPTSSYVADAGLRMELRVLIVIAFTWCILVGKYFLDTRHKSTSEIGRVFLPVLYIGLPLSLACEICAGPLAARRVMWVVLVAKACDIGGWVFGKLFGKHKMVPTVSPGKSWEGTTGGIVLSIAAAVFLPDLFGLPESEWSVAMRVGFGFMVGAATILVGVTQSGWKRRAGVKDSSALIPEMGGILDMTDSLLFAVPVAYLWYRFVVA